MLDLTILKLIIPMSKLAIIAILTVPILNIMSTQRRFKRKLIRKKIWLILTLLLFHLFLFICVFARQFVLVSEIYTFCRIDLQEHYKYVGVEGRVVLLGKPQRSPVPVRTGFHLAKLNVSDEMLADQLQAWLPVVFQVGCSPAENLHVVNVFLEDLDEF